MIIASMCVLIFLTLCTIAAGCYLAYRVLDDAMNGEHNK